VRPRRAPRWRRRERLSARRALERHVREVQSTVRTCEGCGACCTDEYNAVRVLPVEALRIARHLDGLPRDLRKHLLGRVAAAMDRYQLRPSGPKTRYTCPFLDPDRGCALPLHVKPTACLSFNPVDPDRCEQEPQWYFPAHDAEARANRGAGLPETDAPIPVAVHTALADRDRALREGRGAGGEGTRGRGGRGKAG